MRLLISVLTLLLVATPALAQDAPRVSFGAFGGKSWIVGKADLVPGSYPLTGAHENGFHVGLRSQVDRGLGPFDLRVDAMYSKLTGQTEAYSVGRMAMRDEFYAAIGSIVLPFNRGGRFAPYLTAGAGIFHSRLGTNPIAGVDEITEFRSGTGLGLTAGAGMRVRLERFDLLLETRLANALNATSGRATLPISVGFMIRP